MTSENRPMTHLELLFAALWASDGWYNWFAERTDISQSRKLYGRARAAVIYDRVICSNDPYQQRRLESFIAEAEK
jgi:hypothetical protein